MLPAIKPRFASGGRLAHENLKLTCFGCLQAPSILEGVTVIPFFPCKSRCLVCTVYSTKGVFNWINSLPQFQLYCRNKALHPPTGVRTVDSEHGLKVDLIYPSTDQSLRYSEAKCLWHQKGHDRDGGVT